MFVQIGVERAKKQMSVKDLANESGIVYDTLLSKLNGKREFTLSEMLRIRSCLDTRLSLDDLFRQSEKEAG